MVAVVMAFLPAGETRHSNFMSTLLGDVIFGTGQQSAMHVLMVAAAPCSTCGARSMPVNASVTRFFGGGP